MDYSPALERDVDSHAPKRPFYEAFPVCGELLPPSEAMSVVCRLIVASSR